TSEAVGGVDTIVLGNGSNLAVGGAQGDLIDGGDGYNLVVGDSGRVTGIDAATGGANRFGSLRLTLGRVEASRDNVGGVDTITVGNGDNLVVGGAYGDTVTAGHGTNVILGDSGEIHSTHTNAHPFGTLPLTPYRIFTVTDWTGAADTIHVGDGDN